MHTHSNRDVSTNRNSLRLRKQTCKVGILSPRLQCPVFPHSLLFICSLLCFLLSQLSDCALLLPVSASHFAITAVNRSVEVGSPKNPSAEESRQRLMEKVQQMIKKVAHVCAFVCLPIQWLSRETRCVSLLSAEHRAS